MPRSLLPTLRTLPMLLRLGVVALAGCQAPTRATAPTALYGRWEKIETSLPPITLDLRASATSVTGSEGQVWLSGVTYTLPATIDDTSIVLADPASSKPAPFVAVLQQDGTLRVRLNGDPPHEATLVRRNLND